MLGWIGDGVLGMFYMQESELVCIKILITAGITGNEHISVQQCNHPNTNCNSLDAIAASK